MLKKILIANRGEIALRILRCCREMDIETVLVYSTEDEESLPVMLASEAFCIGGAKAKDSYLNKKAIIDVALKTKCDAVHPGYGFLSENADFARMCRDEGLVFIGPSAEIIEKMGDKQQAIRLMRANKIPVVSGSEGCISSVAEALKCAESIGYPVLIKASAGGGGKGMRIVEEPSAMENAYNSAKAEAEAAFGNGDLYMEKLIINPRHVEVQILADKYGNIVHLGERDCSLQRNNQKLMEESPACGLSEKTVKEIRRAAVTAAAAAGYFSAGTVEFIVDQAGKFYFIEMNTRIQVEHPVTEAVSGTDLIKEQILIADGKKLSFSQKDIVIKGHALECRVNAISAGKITALHFPGGFGVRIESHIYEGFEISPYYDSMIAKIIVHGESRMEAVKRLRRVLEEMIIEGVKTNVHLMYLISHHEGFIKGGYDTSYWNSVEKDLNKRLAEVEKRK